MKFLEKLGFGKKPAATRPAEKVDGKPLEVDAEMLTDVGCVRDSNEDNGRIFRHQTNGYVSGVLAVVADGMGGHAAGEVASAKAVEVLEKAYPGMQNTDPGGRLRRALEEANAAIHDQANREAEKRGMGTTCTALLLQDGYAYSAHVGDSRLYLIRNGTIYLMTEDHSAVMELVKSGALTLGEARHHPDKNVITRSLGSREKVEVSVWPEPLRVYAGDRFILCSDGLYDQVEDDEICATTLSNRLGESCEKLVQLARERGGPDNITVAVVETADCPQPTDVGATRQVKAVGQ